MKKKDNEGLHDDRMVSTRDEGRLHDKGGKEGKTTHGD